MYPHLLMDIVGWIENKKYADVFRLSANSKQSVQNSIEFLKNSVKQRASMGVSGGHVTPSPKLGMHTLLTHSAIVTFIYLFYM